MEPEIVLFGLTFDNLGPLNFLPIINPPMSDANMLIVQKIKDKLRNTCKNKRKMINKI